MSKSVIQNTGVLGGGVGGNNPLGASAVSSVDQQFLENSSTSNELNKRKTVVNGFTNAHLQCCAKQNHEQINKQRTFRL